MEERSILITNRSKMVSNGDSICYLANGERNPVTICIEQLMIACSIDSLFRKEELIEFIARLHLAYPESKVIERFLGGEELFSCNIGDNFIVITVEDILNHVGYDMRNTHLYSTRVNWKKHITGSKKGASLFGVFNGRVLGRKELEMTNELFMELYNEDLKEIVPTEIDEKNADLLASIVEKELFNSAFDYINNCFPDEIAKHSKRINDITSFIEPTFYFEKVPNDLKQRMREQLEEYYFIDNPVTEKLFEYMVFACWAYANGFVSKDYNCGGIDQIWVGEGSNVDLFLAEEMDGMILNNIYYDIMFYEFEEEMKDLFI